MLAIDSNMPLLQTRVCGQCTPRTSLAVSKDYLVCPRCSTCEGSAVRPLVVLGGSGTGKSTLARVLRDLSIERRLPVSILDGDLLLHRRSVDYRAWINDHLLLAINEGLVRIPVAIFLPAERGDFRCCPAMEQLLDPHFIRLVSRPEDIESRLRIRPSWRGWTTERIDAEVGRGGCDDVPSLNTSLEAPGVTAERLWKALPR